MTESGAFRMSESSNGWETVIGLEIHAQLSTVAGEAKIEFCWEFSEGECLKID